MHQNGRQGFLEEKRDARLVVNGSCSCAALRQCDVQCCLCAKSGSKSFAEFPWVLTNPVNPEYLPPSSGLGPITYDKARPHIARLLNNVGNVVERPLPLADLSNPNLRPWVVDFLRKANDLMLAGKLRYSSRASCLPVGVPMFWKYGAGFQPIWFIQTPRKILIINIGDSQIRRVYMNVPHSPDFKSSWYGESVGR